MPEPTDLELWRCTEATLQRVLRDVDAGRDDEVRRLLDQLVGLAHHARTRPGDRTDERAAELSAVLDSLAEHPLVFDEWPIVSSEPRAVLEAVSRVLALAVQHAGAGGDEVRRPIHDTLVHHLDQDLASTGHLLAHLPCRPSTSGATAPADPAALEAAVEGALARYRAAAALPIPLLDEAAAWLRAADRAAGGADARELSDAAAFEHFVGACEQLARLTALAGEAGEPEHAIVGIAVHQSTLRRLADLIG